MKGTKDEKPGFKRSAGPSGKVGKISMEEGK